MSVEIQTMGEGGIFEIAAVVIDEVLEIQPFTDVEYEILSSARDILAEGSILEAATVATNSANTAAGLASEAASAANGAAGLANSATTSANTAAGLASEAASAANDAAGLANSATTSANTAAGAANSAATSATSAAGAANTAASSANSAASAANTAAATAASFVGTGPAGYYATLTALQAAYPTGDTGIYVELEYGHWYYWSGSAWIDGGLFQAPLAVAQTTGTSTTDVMSQKAVTDELIGLGLKLGDITHLTEIGKNLFDKSNIINGKYLDTGTGALTTYSLAAISSLIPIVPNKKYYLTRLGDGQSECRFVESDGVTSILPIKEDGTPFERYDSGGSSVCVIAPANAAYFQFTIKINESLGYDINTIQFEEGNQHTSYEAYSITDIWGYNALPSKVSDVVNDAFKMQSKNIYSGGSTRGYVDAGTGVVTVTSGENYYVTTPIPVKPNTFYYLSGRTNSAFAEATGLSQDKLTRIKLQNVLGVENSLYYINGINNILQLNGQFKTSSDTYFVQFTIRGGGLPAADYTHIMLEEVGASYDPYFEPKTYQPYELVPIINAENMPNPDNSKNISPLFGKIIAYNGDSICESRISGNAINGGAYAKIISDKTGCLYVNNAVSGALLSHYEGSAAHQIVDDVVNMPNNADLICFEGGVNDWSIGVPIGSITAGYSNSFDNTTLTGALESIFYQAINKWVGKPIVFVICHKVEGSDAEPNGYSFSEAAQRIQEVCDKWGIPCVDICNEGILNGNIPALKTAYLNASMDGNPDGWHPNEAGYEIYYVPTLIAKFESLLNL